MNLDKNVTSTERPVRSSSGGTHVSPVHHDRPSGLNLLAPESPQLDYR